MLALELTQSELAQWRASMRLLLKTVYGREFPYSVTSRVGGLQVTGTVTRHAVPYRHASKADAILFEITPAFEAALNSPELAKLPTPHRERLLAYQAACTELDDSLVGEDAEASVQAPAKLDTYAKWW